MSSILHLAKVTAKVLPVALKYDPSGEIEPISAAIDVSTACNLRCKHCYLYRDEPAPYAWNENQQMTDEQWIARIRRLKEYHPHIVHATWVGGEPLMRKNLLKKGTQHFLLNWVVTNGTIQFGDGWNDNTTFIVSLDGPEQYHNQIRGNGMFQRSLRNVQQARVRVYSHSVINSINQAGIEDLLEQLYGTRIKGIRFSFHTPEYGVDDPLWLPPKERDMTVDRIHSLKEKYGKFIWMTHTEIDALSSEKQLEVFGDNCALKRKADISLDFPGNVKEPCVMGRVLIVIDVDVLYLQWYIQL